jgi:hypothetical protein
MKAKDNKIITGRRDALKLLGLGSASIFMGEFGRIPSVDMYETPVRGCQNEKHIHQHQDEQVLHLQTEPIAGQ